MAVTTTNLIAGPADLYIATFGAAEPLDTDIANAPGVAWTDLGGTQDGVTLAINQEFFELEVDQIVDVPGRRLVKRDLQITTNLAEATLTALQAALNGGTVTPATGSKAYEPTNDNSATQPTYRAVLVDGWAPQTTAGASARRRIIVRKVLSIENVETAYKKDEQSLFPVTFAAHYVSSAVKPFRVIDQVPA
jgi:hypothetical protein